MSEPEIPPEPDDPAAVLRLRVARLDKVVDALLAEAELDETPAKVKAQLFQTVVRWQKEREKLLPKNDGSELKRMSDAIRSKGHKRAGSGGRNGEAAHSDAINGIIGDLKRQKRREAARERDAARAGGDPQDPLGAGVGDAGDPGGVLPHGWSDGAGDGNGSGNLH